MEHKSTGSIIDNLFPDYPIKPTNSLAYYNSFVAPSSTSRN